MMTTALISAVATRPALCVAQRPSSRTVRAARVVVRASEETTTSSASVDEASAAPRPVSASSPVPAAAEPFSILGAQQEAINGRAAMVGFLVAIATEVATNQSVWSQIAGKYVDRELVQQPIGASTMAFAFVVVAMTFASFAPSVFKGEGPASRSVGPFTPAAEALNGRAAMLGFSALLLTELVKGNTPLF